MSDISQENRIIKLLEERIKRLEAREIELQTRLAAEIFSAREKEELMIHQSRLATMGEMISNIAHQWRQPLYELSCMIQMLKLDLPPESRDLPQLDAFVSGGLDIITYMSRTIDDFRNFFQPSRKAASFDPSEAIYDAISLIKASLKGAGIEISCNCTGNYRIYGHSNEISQVLLNLINNARDALLSANVDSPFISISCIREADSVVIRVEDNGGGIPEKIMEKIFDPYFTTKQKSHGTGLGLYMSRVIVESSGDGRLTACNTAHGALFAITLPISDGNSGEDDASV